MSKPVILFVEDDEQLRPLLAHCLEEAFGLKYEVRVFSDEPHARAWMIENARTREVSLLITDWDMTVRGAGAKVIRDLRTYFPAARAVVATGNIGNDEAISSHRPDGILHKPFIMPQLVEAARRLLEEAVPA